MLHRLFGKKPKMEIMRHLSLGRTMPERVFAYPKEQCESEISFARYFMNNNPNPHWYAHGTNGKAFEGILQVLGRVLPYSLLIQQGRNITSGEGFGAINSDSISAIALTHMNLGSTEMPILHSIHYAMRATDCFALRPSNIDARLNSARETFKKMEIDFARDGQPFPNSHLGRAYRTLPALISRFEQQAVRFSQMSEQDKQSWENLSSIPVVVIGQSESERICLEKIDIPGEVFLGDLNARIIASEPCNFDRLRSLSKSYDFPLSFVPFGSLEELQREHLKRYGYKF